MPSVGWVLAIGCWLAFVVLAIWLLGRVLPSAARRDRQPPIDRESTIPRGFGT